MWSVSGQLYLGVGRNLPEIGIERIAKDDLVHQRRTTLSRLGVESSCSIISNGPKHSIDVITSRYFEP